MLLASASSSSKIPPIAAGLLAPSVMAAAMPSGVTSAQFFAETEILVKDHVRMDPSDKTEAKLPKSTANKLNFQSLDSTQLMRMVLLLMAKACVSDGPASTVADGSLGAVVSAFLTPPEPRREWLRTTEADSVLFVGLDRAYAVECADSTFTNLLSILDNLFAGYHNTLSSFVTGSTDALNEKIARVRIDPRGGDGGAPVRTTGEANEADAALAADIAGAGGLTEPEKLDADRLVSQFEPLFCILVIFAANIEVFADRCKDLHRQRSAAEGFRVRAKDWRNIQRELGRMAHISLEEKVPDSEGKDTDRSDESRMRRRDLNNFDRETEGDDELAADVGDGDAEYSLGSVESEERRLLQSIARQQQQHHQHHHDYDIDGAEQHQKQHHQQDQQSDDEGGTRDYHDEKSSFEGDQDFGADSGDDSFFSGDRSRRRGMTGSYDQEDDQSRDDHHHRPFDTEYSGPYEVVVVGPGQASNAPGAPVLGSARGARQPSELTGEYSQESSLGGDRERDSGGAPFISRGDSPALSFDSLGYPLDHGDRYDGELPHGEEEYLSESGSDSQDSRFDRRTNQTGTADDDDDMQRYYEEQAQEMENLDLQRAIISSMQEGTSPVVFESSMYRNCLLQLDGKPGRFGEGIGLSTPGSAPAIPRIRDLVNSMTSKCYLALESLCAPGLDTATGAPGTRRANSPSPPVQSAGTPERVAVESVYLLWEAAQVVTTVGFDALYSEQDQHTVLAQLIHLPSSFLYIVPGIIKGAIKNNKLYALISSLMLPKEAFFTGTQSLASALESKQPERSDNVLDLGSVIAFLEFLNSHIRACRDVAMSPPPMAAGQSDSVGRRQRTAAAADQFSVKMFGKISSALFQLAKSLLQVVFDRIKASKSFLNETIGFLPDQPLGPDVAKMFDLLTDIASSDLEVLVTKLSAFDDRADGRFYASFTATVVGFVYSRAMQDFGVMPAAALLPHSIKLLRLFQSSFDTYKRFPAGKDAFNAWLVSTFQWVVYHVSGSVNLLLCPPQQITPPEIRRVLLSCRNLFGATDVRKCLNGSATGVGVYAWEQQVWSLLSRSDAHAMSRTNSTMSKDSALTPDTPTDRLDISTGVETALLIVASFAVTAFPILSACRARLWDHKQHSGTSIGSKFFSLALADLFKDLSGDKLSQYLQQLHRGDVPAWQSFPVSVQGFLALLHTVCRSQGIPLSGLASAIATLESESKKNESGRLAAVQALLNSSTDLINAVSAILHSFVLYAAVLEHISLSQHIANKTTAVRSLVSTSKNLLSSGYNVLVNTTLPLTLVKDALFECLNRGTSVSSKLEALISNQFVPLRAAVIRSLADCNVHLDARVHVDLTLKSMLSAEVSISAAPPVPAAHDMLSKLAVFLLCKNLPLQLVAQLCLWEEDCLRNKQFALSLLVFLVESLHLSPEAMHYSAESLQSFVDPLETLEEIAYVLTHQSSSDATACALSKGKAAAGLTSASTKVPGTAVLSIGHKAEQLLTKLDSYLTSKISSLPSTAAAPLKAGAKALFGTPSLKQIPDLLTLVRYSLVAQAQFGEHSQNVTEQVSPLTVSMAPFTTSLKKSAEAIGILLRTHKPENHGGLQLADALAANKYLHLLQSSLSGLSSLQGIETHQRLMQSGRAIQVDKLHDRTAFLHAMCGVLTPLGSMMKVLVTCFQQHLLFCQAVGAQFLFPSIKAIEHTSPTILSNVFTPQGSYTVGFWLYIPPRSVLFPTAESGGDAAHATARFHLLSRMYECGEMNLVSLLNDNPADAPACFSLSVHLVVDPTASESESGMHLEVTVAATDYVGASRESLNTSANARTKAAKKMCVKSKDLNASEWISCVVELVQDSIALPRDTSVDTAVGAAAKALARKNYKTKYQDTTCAALFVNGGMHASAAMTGGRSALHQNMVLGKVPRKLGISTGEKDQIIVTDVFWIPTSIYLASASSGYDKVRLLLSKLGSEHMVQQLKQVDTAKVDVHDSGDFYGNLLPRCPPSLLLETLDNAFHCSARLLELITANVTAGTNNAASSNNSPANSKTEKTAEHSLPLNLVPILCIFATDVICVGDARCQEAAIKALCCIIDVLPPPHGLSEAGEVDVSKAAIMASTSPAGSAFNAAVQNKTSLLLRQAISHCFGLVEDLTRSSFADGCSATVGPDAFDVSCLKESPYVQSTTSNKDIWRKRLKFARLSVERCVRIPEWGSRIGVDENLLITGFSSLLALAVRKRLVDAQFQKDCGVLANMLSGGGWSPLVSVGRIAQLSPRRLFLHFDPRTFEQCAFPSSAVVMGASATRPGVWLSHCDGAYQRTDQLAYFNPLLPRNQRSASLSTEMVSAQDPFVVLNLAQLGRSLEGFSLKSAEELMTLLKGLVAQPSVKVKAAVVQKKSLHTRSLANQFENAIAPGANTPGGDSLAEELQSELQASTDQSYLDLMQEIAYLRCLAVQLTHAKQDILKPDGEADESSISQLKLLHTTVSDSLTKILGIAVQDPVQAVSAIFSSGTFKGVQLDVLKNLLKEGDISFLEKISLRLWKQYKCDINPSCETGYGTATANAPLIQLTSLAGEVVISETKIRALSHFPSVRLQGVALERMTGRWFYECTLLSDGLIQIGWANAMFRCDPICGQGVGDHTHSWAYDGLRCKKWNVSCEAYGRRWRLGDTIGALIDMDLLEIRFYLNGEDLGQAFEDFSGYDIFPALSLNVRQCVRLNFGQYKFLHPPDELDGKPFKPVLQALVEKQAAVSAAVSSLKSPPSSSVKAKPSAAPFSIKSTSSDTILGEDGERLQEGMAAPLSPMAERAVAAGIANFQLDGVSSPHHLSPIRQALMNGMGTPAGAETPSTQMITPAHTPGPTQLLAQIEESPTATATAPSAVQSTAAADAVVGFSTPPRSNNAGGDTPAAATSAELQEESERASIREVTLYVTLYTCQTVHVHSSPAGSSV